MSSQLRKVTLIANGQSQEWLSAVGPFSLLTERPGYEEERDAFFERQWARQYAEGVRRRISDDLQATGMCKYEIFGEPCECTCTPKQDDEPDYDTQLDEAHTEQSYGEWDQLAASRRNRQSPHHSRW